MKRLVILAACALALASCGGRQLKASSAVLGTDLPGALVAERGAGSILDTTRQMAQIFHEECGPVEAFEVADHVKTRKALEDAIVSKGYTKRLITTESGSEVYTLTGPKRLLVVDSTNSLGICEVLAS